MRIFSRTFSDLVAYDCEELLHLCMYQGHSFQCCHPKHMSHIYNAYGRCYSITPPIKEGESFPHQKIPGVQSGLQISIEQKSDTFTPEVVQYNFIGSGALLGISYDKHPARISNPIGVKPNTIVWVALRESRKINRNPLLKVFSQDCYHNLQLDLLEGTILI